MDSKNLGADLVISAAILLHQREQDHGAGITHISGVQKTLWAYYRQQRKRAEAQIVQGAFLTGYIRECVAQMKRLVESVDEMTDKAILLKVGEQVDALNIEIAEANIQLEALYG